MTTDKSPAPSKGAPRRYGNFIEGRWRDGTEELARYAPGTNSLASTVAASTPAEVDAAVTAARQAFDKGIWSNATGFDRAAVLNRVADLIDTHAERLARLDAEEGGKPLRLARGDIAGAAMLTRYAAGLAVQMHLHQQRPRLHRSGAARAGRCRGADHAVELPGAHPLPEAPVRLGGWLLGGG